jgi:dTDP-4-dehydrorhamnose 3,5-epimerase
MTTISHSEVINDVLIVNPDVFSDERGLFVETYRKEWFPEKPEMVQSNRADRQKSCIVGLHYHLFQADYWYVPLGAARVILHDLRTESSTNGSTISIDLGLQADGSHDHSGIYIPPGVAHGFGALTDMTITYLVDNYYNPSDELGIAWDDPEIAANWGLESPTLSKRDQENPKKSEIKPSLMPGT